MKRLIDIVTVLLCGLTAVCTVLLKMDKVWSIFSHEDGTAGMIGKADDPTVVFVTKKLKSISDARSTKMLYLATAAAVSAFLLRIFNQIRLERALSSLTKNRG